MIGNKSIVFYTGQLAMQVLYQILGTFTLKRIYINWNNSKTMKMIRELESKSYDEMLNWKHLDLEKEIGKNNFIHVKRNDNMQK